MKILEIVSSISGTGVSMTCTLSITERTLTIA
jgi:hypothetical protein